MPRLPRSDLRETKAMGLDAYVTCRCWEEGLCDPPASIASRLRYDPVRAELDRIEPEGLSAQEGLALYLEDDLWFEQSACAHPKMWVAHERISNWGGLGAFRHALRSLGENPCATLLREIPDSNGGMTKPVDARACLVELSHFCAMGPFGQLNQIIECSHGDVIIAEGGWLGTSGSAGVTLRLTADGTFQIESTRGGVLGHNDEATILFRSRMFHLAKTPPGEFIFTDLHSGQKLLCSFAFYGASDLCPSTFEVAQSKDNPARYAYCVEPLRRIFHAALANNHPVLWF